MKFEKKERKKEITYKMELKLEKTSSSPTLTEK